MLTASASAALLKTLEEPPPGVVFVLATTDPQKLPELLKGFKAVPPLVTDINLSLDDKFLVLENEVLGKVSLPRAKIAVVFFDLFEVILRFPGDSYSAIQAAFNICNSNSESLRIIL